MIAHGELEAFNLKPALPAGACLSLLACVVPFKIRRALKFYDARLKFIELQ